MRQSRWFGADALGAGSRSLRTRSKTPASSSGRQGGGGPGRQPRAERVGRLRRQQRPCRAERPATPSPTKTAIPHARAPYSTLDGSIGLLPHRQRADGRGGLVPLRVPPAVLPGRQVPPALDADEHRGGQRRRQRQPRRRHDHPLGATRSTSSDLRLDPRPTPAPATAAPALFQVLGDSTLGVRAPSRVTTGLHLGLDAQGAPAQPLGRRSSSSLDQRAVPRPRASLDLHEITGSVPAALPPQRPLPPRQQRRGGHRHRATPPPPPRASPPPTAPRRSPTTRAATSRCRASSARPRRQPPRPGRHQRRHRRQPPYVNPSPVVGRHPRQPPGLLPATTPAPQARPWRRCGRRPLPRQPRRRVLVAFLSRVTLGAARACSPPISSLSAILAFDIATSGTRASSASSRRRRPGSSSSAPPSPYDSHLQ